MQQQQQQRVYKPLSPVSRAVDVENAIKLAAAGDGYVTYQELRMHLRNFRYVDAEIDLFFYHFQNDPVLSQMILDEEEVKARQLKQDKKDLQILQQEEEEQERTAHGFPSARMGATGAENRRTCYAIAAGKQRGRATPCSGCSATGAWSGRSGGATLQATVAV